jgi:hypothetical protein
MARAMTRLPTALSVTGCAECRRRWGQGVGAGFQCGVWSDDAEQCGGRGQVDHHRDGVVAVGDVGHAPSLLSATDAGAFRAPIGDTVRGAVGIQLSTDSGRCT